MKKSKFNKRSIPLIPCKTSFKLSHELVPKYKKFTYILKNYSEQVESIIYSDPYEINGIEWRLKIYPKGNGVAKNTHISVFL